MIERMKFVSITGAKEEFDRMAANYLSKYEVHLENALSELKTVQNLRPFIEKNPYKDRLEKLRQYVGELPGAEQRKKKVLDTQEAEAVLEQVYQALVPQEKRKEEILEELEHVKNIKSIMEPFKEVDVDLRKLSGFQFVKVRFGRIVLQHYTRLEHYMLEDSSSIFYKCGATPEYVYGIYFVPKIVSKKIDAMYASMHFEQIQLPEEYEGTPMKAYLKYDQRQRKLESELETIQTEIQTILTEAGEGLVAARERFQMLSEGFDIRKMAACFQEEEEVFYIICGWMSEEDAAALKKEIEGDANTFFVEEDGEESAFQEPPTKLKNPRFLRPFEMFTKMYGLPGYNEMDPTVFIAITYTLIFGIMFGDVGQGLVLLIGGTLLFKFKKIDLAAIISCAGIFSTIFGFLYGSVFGFEDILEAVWLHPKAATMEVPIVGQLNTVFVVTIGFGMALILLTMVFHMINAAKEKNLGSLLFDTNGVAGLVFYGAVVAVILLFMQGKTLPATGVLLVMFILPLLAICLKEPLGNLVERKAEIMPKEKGMFVVQTFFELFEVLLSYFSNTLSFIRVGAFAVSHAAMMEVVLTLAGAESGSVNWIVIVLGNIAVCGLEGLIVGIQVLRLEYYEMFSRFYKGTGREFISYKSHIHEK